LIRLTFKNNYLKELFNRSKLLLLHINLKQIIIIMHKQSQDYHSY